MIKSQLTKRISEASPHLYHQDIERIVDAILQRNCEAQCRGEGISKWRGALVHFP